MKFVDKIAQHGKRRLFYTFEFFPPKTDQVSAQEPGRWAELMQQYRAGF